MAFDLMEEHQKEIRRTHLFFHETFCNSLDLLKSRPNMGSLYIENEYTKDRYYYFLPLSTSDYVSTKNSITITKPKLIQITCGSAKHSMVEGTYLPLLKRIPLTIKFAVDAEFWVHSFKTLQWIPLNPDCAHLISIKLLDERGTKVRLSPGFPTYIVLKIRSYSPLLSTKAIMNPSSRFTIHISSTKTERYPHNAPHHFFVDLPNTLDFPFHEWQVALTHICYPSKMRILESLNMTLKIQDWDNNTLTDIELPSTLNTCEQIIQHFADAISPVAKLITWKTGIRQIAFKKKATLTLGSSLAYILGHQNSDLNIEKHVIINNKIGNQQFYAFKTRPKIVQLYPASLFLYSRNLCEYSLVGGRKLPILSVINHQSSTDTLYDINEMEIINPNFVPIAQTQVSTLEFFIYAHDDQYVRFINDDAVVFMSLAFEKI